MRIIIAMFISLVILAILELFSIAWIWHRIGGASTILIILGTGIIGAFIARKNAKKALKRLMKGAPSDAGPAKQMFDAVAFFLAAALLIIPGVITDVIGLLLLLPFTRSVLYSKLIKKSEAGQQFTTGFNSTRYKPESSLNLDSVIDVQAEEVED
jgi:UPF0716 protein FxsA